MIKNSNNSRSIKIDNFAVFRCPASITFKVLFIKSVLQNTQKIRWNESKTMETSLVQVVNL